MKRETEVLKAMVRSWDFILSAVGVSGVLFSDFIFKKDILAAVWRIGNIGGRGEERGTIRMILL